MSLLQAALGVLLAMLLFGAVLWGAYRCVTSRGATRALAATLSLTTILGMATISAGLAVLAIPTGVALAILGLAAIWSEPGWSKLLPFAQAIFGLALVSGLPFAPS